MNTGIQNSDTTTIEEAVTDRILTIPNVISAIRLCMIPVFFVLLLCGYDLAATIIFVLAASSDFIDGQIARRTHCVSKLGQILDPAADRLLMVFGVLGLLIVGRLPLWIVVIVILRDAILLCGGAYLIKNYSIRIPVVFAGKVATTCLFFGFFGLLLNYPMLPGLGIVEVTWLPGFSSALYSWGIWFVYLGLCIGLVTTCLYVFRAVQAFNRVRRQA